LWESATAVDVARALDAGWSKLGLRLALEAPSTTSSVLFGHPEVRRERVLRFSERELREFLTRRGLDHAALPSYVREPLRLPVLASIYAEVVQGEPNWRPTNEYEVVGRFWHRLSDGLIHRGHPSDLTGVKRLAASFVAGTSYPFDFEQVEAARLEDANLERLERSGWLARDELGRWSFGHDRLLNWAVAVVLVSRWAASAFESSELAAMVNRLSEGEWSGDARRVPRLGFLLMDVIWLAAEHDRIEANRLAALIRSAEEHVGHGYPEELYTRLLPTAGPAILPALAARIGGGLEDQNPTLMARLFAGALLEIARVSKSSVIATTVALWRSPRSAARETALHVAASMPIVELREELWQELVSRSVALQRKEAGGHHAHEQAFRAVDQITQTDPDWLEEKTLVTSDGDGLALCAWLLAGLEHPEASSLWSRRKDRMFHGLSKDRVRGLAACIQRFRDLTELARVEVWAREERDHVAWVAWPALCELAPQRALAVLPDVPAAVLWTSNRAWLLTLLEHDELGAHQRLREVLTNRDPAGVDLAMVWKDIPDLLDAGTAECLLDCLTIKLSETLDDDLRGSWHILELLADGRISPANHDLFVARRASGLERALSRLAHARLARCTGIDRDWRLDQLKRLLARIGGQEYERLVVAGLKHDNHLIRRESARDALRVPAPDVLSHLWLLAAQLTDEDNAQGVTMEAWRSLLVLDPDGAQVRIRDLLASGDRPSQHWGAWLAREAGDQVHRLGVEALLARAEPGSVLEVRAIEAAFDLGVDSVEMVGRATRLLSDENYVRQLALNILLSSKSKDAKEILDRYLAETISRPNQSLLTYEALAIRCCQPDASPQMIDLLRRLSRHHFQLVPQLFHSLAEHPAEDAQDILLEAAFSDGDSHGSASPAAIAALTRGDQEAAERAFVRAWRLHARSRVSLAPLAPRLGPESIGVLVAELPAEEDESTRRAICLALRQTSSVAAHALEQLAHSQWGSERQAVAEALGWLENGGELLQRLTRDDDATVRSSARWSMLQRRRQQSALAWLTRLDEAGESGRYELIDYALSLLDPDIAGSVSDQAAVGPFVERLPALCRFAKYQLKMRQEEIERTRLPRNDRRLRPRLK
jgi:hypothetical protein